MLEVTRVLTKHNQQLYESNRKLCGQPFGLITIWSFCNSNPRDGTQSEALYIQPSTSPDLTLATSPFKASLQLDHICTKIEGFIKPVLVAVFEPPYKLPLDNLGRNVKPTRSEILLYDIVKRVTGPRFGTDTQIRNAAVITQNFAYACSVRLNMNLYFRGDFGLSWDQTRGEYVEDSLLFGRT